MNKLSLFVALTLVSSISAWYECDDKEFCKTIRYKDGDQHFKVVGDDITQTGTQVKATLLNTQTNEKLSLLVTGLKEGNFRVQIGDDSKPRFIPSQALLDELPTNQIQFDNEAEQIVITNEYTKAFIKKNPFSIDIKNDFVHIEINKKGRMEFMNDDKNPAIAMDFSFPNTQHLYGLPEHAERLKLQNTKANGLQPYRMYNVDYPGYATEKQEPLYGTIPVVYAHGEKTTAGVFWLNSAQTFVDVNAEENETDAFFISEAGMIDFFTLMGPTIKNCVAQYVAITGTAPLPQLFTMGYHQSRYSYMTQDDLESVVANMDENDFPVDVMWLDIDYTDGIKYFTWNYTAYPNPLEMQAKLDAMGRKLVVILDPHIKAEKGYFVYDEGVKNDYFVRNADGSVYEGICWPGMSTYVDYHNPEASKWYGSLYSYEKFNDTSSIVHIWNDMNEPSVFEVDEKTMDNNLLHYGDVKHRDVHNMFGFLQTKATFEGLQARFENKQRPFILTRAHFAGSQRYTAVWTGDNVASWEHMRFSIPMCLTEALGGMSFCGADIGGFIDNPSEELLQRWYQLGAWLPFYRGHSGKDTDRREPYLFPKEVQKRFRDSIKMRYEYLPVWYTLFFEHQLYGSPVMRPMVYQYPNDPNTFTLDEQFMIGSDILVAPVLKSGVETLKVYLPGKDNWWPKNEANGWAEVNVDMNSIPVFHRQGSIVPLKPIARNATAHMHNDPFDFHIYADAQGKATGRLYVDDYVSYDYKNKAYHYMSYNYKNGAIKSVKIHSDADFDAEIIIDNIYVFTTNDKYTSSSYSMEYNREMGYYKLSNVNLQGHKVFDVKLLQ